MYKEYLKNVRISIYFKHVCFIIAYNMYAEVCNIYTESKFYQINKKFRKKDFLWKFANFWKYANCHQFIFY